MNLSVKLITALAAFVLLVVGLVGLTSSGSTARAAVDAKVYVANEWSNLTNDPTPLSGYTYAGAGKTIYGTFVEVNDASGVEQSTIAGTGNNNANRVALFVEDADVNVSVAKSQTIGTHTLTNAADDTIVILSTGDSPIVDSGTVGILDGVDITISGSEASRVALAGAVAGSTSSGGVITLVQVGATPPTPGGANVLISWKTSAIDTLVVKVTSTQNTTGKTFTISETAASTGVFQGSIDLTDVARGTTNANDDNSVPTDNSTGGTIAIQNGSILTLTYSDATPASGSSTAKSITSTLTAETGAPVIAVTTPVNSSATQIKRPTFAGSVNDTTSGLDISTIAVHVDTTAETTNSSPVEAQKGGTTDSNSPTLPPATADGTTSTTFSYVASADLPESTPTPDHEVDWQVQAIDLAGNIGWSDSKTSGTGSANVDTTKGSTGIGQNGRGQAHIVKIDQTLPGISNVYTGFVLDATGSSPVRKANNKKSIEVEFNDKIDGGTVVNTDFEVVVGSVTQVPAEAVVGGTGFEKRVFLTLDSDLATKDAPTVKIVGSIADAAGNTTSTGSKLGVDAIAPTLTVALSGGSSATAPATLTKDKMTITITSDEALASDPTVEVYDEAWTTGSAETTVTAVNQGSNTWVATYSKGSALDGDTSNPDGFKKSVVVTANDAATLTSGTLSSGTTIDGSPTVGEAVKGKKLDTDTGAILFTLDGTAPALTLSPASDTSDSSPFVRWNFKEVVTVSLAQFGLSTDTLLGDVTAELETSDNKEYIRPTSNLALGTYKVTATVTDLAGNKATGLNDTFKVIKRAEFKMTILPGTSLVSFPLSPSDTSINSVFSPAGIVSVSSYNASAGTFSSAVRDSESGDLAGALGAVESGIGYIVVADAVAALVVPIPSLSASSIPPSIALSAGWNLVGVTDVTGDSNGAVRADNSTLTTRSVYFPSKVSQVYKWDATLKIWSQIATGDNVAIGDAYWAFATAADTIVP